MSHPRDKKLKILIASAWTGGHIFPGISICEEIKKDVEYLDAFFITNKKGPSADILSRYGYHAVFMDVGSIKGKGKKAVKNVLKLFPTFFKSLIVVKRISPSIILGMGGSLSGPICVAGKLLDIPVAIHEQNVLPGFTNRILCYFVDKIFVSFQETKNMLKRKGIVVSGNPVRKEFFHIKKEKKDAFTILIMGGSQGSLAINRAFLDALAILNRKGKKINVIHQTGETGFEEVKRKYKELGLQAHIIPFIEDMPSALKEANLVIGRAGASTIFELSASGTPSILIPYPYATDHHQEKNALALARIGGAEIILQKDLTGLKLARSIETYIAHPEKLEKMCKNAKLLAHTESAKIIAKEIMEMIRI